MLGAGAQTEAKSSLFKGPLGTLEALPLGINGTVMTQTVIAAELCCGFSSPARELIPHSKGAPEDAPELLPDVLMSLQRLQKKASGQGFDLVVASAFRSFERQLVIWNAKAEGLRPVLDDANRVVDMAGLSELERVLAIMRFSALPGASRHHWGTDIDIYDRSALADGGRVQLLPSESAVGGVFYNFHSWLDRQLAGGDCEGFYRPYNEDRGGISPEPWHLSYAPLSSRYQASLTVDVLAEAIESAEICFKSTILNNLDLLFKRFIALP